MEIVQELQLQNTDDRKEQSSHGITIVTQKPQHPRLRDYKWWIGVFLCIIFLLAGISTATILTRLYYDKGGSSKWITSFLQSGGFPVLLPLRFYVSRHDAECTNMYNNGSSKIKPKTSTLLFFYLVLGLLGAGVSMMYSYGLQNVPVSTYSLLCATQVAFNALFSFFLNSQKFTALIFNSIFLLTISASLLAINAHSQDSKDLPSEKYLIGFLCTLGGSAAYALYLSLVQLSFEKVIKRKTFSAVLDMQFYPPFITACACVVGLFASGEWRTLDKEMEEYQKGKVSYVMTLFWAAVAWQMAAIGSLGLVFEVSSLFSNVIATLALPIVPILAVIFFHDKINGLKVIALLLAVWGVLSYIYQHYLDDKKAKKAKKSDSLEAQKVEAEIC